MIDRLFIKELFNFLTEVERIGFIIEKDDILQIVETVNISPSPEDSFIFDPQDLKDYVFSEDINTIATWHTHINGSANLSSNDYIGFLNYPNLKHIIIADNEIRIYEVIDGAIIQHAQD